MDRKTTFRFDKDRDAQRRQPRRAPRRQGSRSAVVRAALLEA